LLGETSDRRTSTLAELRLRFEQCTKISPEDKATYFPDTSDASLIRFLRGKKFRVDKALATITNLVEFRKEHPEWCCSPDSANEYSAFNSFFSVLPIQADAKQLIVTVRPALAIKILGDANYRKDHPHAMIRFNLWMLEALSYNLIVQVYGFVVINSFGGFTFMDNLNLANVAPVNERLAMFKYISQSCPFRVQGIYILHQPAYVTWLWGVISIFLSSKLTSRLHFCGDDYGKLRLVKKDASTLPSFFGGATAGKSLITWRHPQKVLTLHNAFSHNKYRRYAIRLYCRRRSRESRRSQSVAAKIESREKLVIRNCLHRRLII